MHKREACGERRGNRKGRKQKKKTKRKWGHYQKKMNNKNGKVNRKENRNGREKNFSFITCDAAESRALPPSEDGIGISNYAFLSADGIF